MWGRTAITNQQRTNVPWLTNNVWSRARHEGEWPLYICRDRMCYDQFLMSARSMEECVVECMSPMLLLLHGLLCGALSHKGLWLLTERIAAMLSTPTCLVKYVKGSESKATDLKLTSLGTENFTTLMWLVSLTLTGCLPPLNHHWIETNWRQRIRSRTSHPQAAYSLQ